MIRKTTQQSLGTPARAGSDSHVEVGRALAVAAGLRNCEARRRVARRADEEAVRADRRHLHAVVGGGRRSDGVPGQGRRRGWGNAGTADTAGRRGDALLADLGEVVQADEDGDEEVVPGRGGEGEGPRRACQWQVQAERGAPPHLALATGVVNASQMKSTASSRTWAMGRGKEGGLSVHLPTMEPTPCAPSPPSP